MDICQLNKTEILEFTIPSEHPNISANGLKKNVLTRFFLPENRGGTVVWW